ncbi:MAG: EAL domain-containing protein [Noviherbaspirillum sp.]
MKFRPLSNMQRLHAQLKAAQRIAQIGSWELQMSNGILTWSEETYRIFGANPAASDVTLDDFWAFVHPDDLARVQSVQTHAVKNNLPLDIEHRIVRCDGEIRHVHECAELHNDDDGYPVLTGTVQDITESKLAQEQAQNLATRLANTLETITDAFYTLDRKWRFTYLNKEAERILQRKRSDLLGKLVWDEFEEAVGTTLYREYHRATREQRPVRFEIFYPPLDVWLEVRAYPSEKGLAVYFRDISQDKQYLEMIRAGEERFKFVAKATSDAIWDWDMKSDRVWWSEGIQSTFGFAPDQMGSGSATWAGLIHPDDQARLLRTMQNFIEGDVERWSDEYRFRRSDGTYAHVLDRSLAIRDSAGQVVRMVGCMTDISAQKRAALELQQLNRALRIRNACDELLYRVTDEREFLFLVCGLMREIGGYSLAWVGNARDDAERSIEIVAHAGEPADIAYVSQLRLSWSEDHPAGWGLGPAGQAIRRGTPVVTEDINQLPGALPWMPFARQRNYRGGICLPLRNKEGVSGMIALYSHQTVHASNEEVTLLQELADKVAFGIDQIRLRHERQRIELAVSTVAASISAATGTAFFEQLARSMGDAVGAQASFVVRLLPGEPRRVRTIAVVAEGKAIPNFEYALAGMPCEQLLDAMEWVVPERAAEALPFAPQLGGFESRAYVGRRLEDSAGQPLGMLFVLFSEPLSRSPLVTDTLRIFASRASAELERQEADARIRSLAFYDALTELPNRRHLQDRLHHALAGSARSGCGGALLFIDLDHFKTINDTLGHDQGDELLRQVAARLAACVRSSDTVARLGGDEFVVMLENLSANPHDAVVEATCAGEKILATLNAPFQLADAQRYSTPSIGIAMFGHEHASPGELLKQADMAMYQAKAAGRNMLRFFDPAMQTRIAARVQLESELRKGLQQQEFLLHLQPQVDRDGALIGAEALLRWRHPARGIVSPAEFIPLAEETGLIIYLGQWVLEKACMQLAAWAHDARTSALTLAVNVSARQFLDRDFVGQVATALDHSGANPRQLKIELTESMLVENVEELIGKMGKLGALGVKFSLDDFGTGYSSLLYLKRLPLYQLKIDQSFVRDVLTDPDDAAIVRTVLALGHSLGLTVIAEGVETEAQRDFLASHGCHAYQGYLFSRPLPQEAFLAFVQDTAMPVDK